MSIMPRPHGQQADRENKKNWTVIMWCLDFDELIINLSPCIRALGREQVKRFRIYEIYIASFVIVSPVFFPCR